jgi:tRNA 2-thiouridine synthesizing protein A
MSTTLDLKGMKCPLPVLRARKALGQLDPGTEIVVLVTDPAAPDDFRAFCEQAGHRLVGIEPDGDGHSITLRRKD